MGTRGVDTPGTKGMRDLMDKLLVLRVENNAMATLLISKGVFTHAEFKSTVGECAAELDAIYELIFKGMRTTAFGVELYDVTLAQQTMTELGFPK